MGVAIGVLVYISLIQPYAYSTCLLDSGSCLKIKYKKKGNTALLRIIPQGYTVWFDGRDALLYGEPTGQVCPGDTETAFVFDLKTDTPKGYLCVKSLDKVKELYSNEKEQVLMVRQESRMGMANLIDIMVLKGVISLNHL